MAILACIPAGLPMPSQAQRLLGLDISAWQGNISQTTWNNIHNVENRQFIILRSSRGGTTGYYDQNDSSNSKGLNTLSQRYDDPYYVQNMNRVVAAGMFAGSYHFTRPDVVESTQNSNGIRNSGADEADHFIQMAGPFMRPGYLPPVHDFEAGDGIRTDNEMAQYCIDFSNRIYERMGIRPAIYINGNFAANILGAASSTLRNQIAQPSSTPPSVISPCYPILWSARWPNQNDPNSINVNGSEPKDTYTPLYGPWDDYGTTHPWGFWQYASTGRLQSFNNGGSNLDMDAVRGGMEFLKDMLIPAVWMNDSSGSWATLANWNSGQTPVAPVAGPGQVVPVGTQALPTPRLPGAAGSGVTAGTNDTVILERPNANITVTLSSGTYNIRKLYMRETLNITGGSLTVNYVPSSDSTSNSAVFSGPVTLSGASSFSVHTLQVDPYQTFTLSGATLAFNTIHLVPNGVQPAKIVMNGNMTFNPLANATASIIKAGGSGSSSFVDLGGSARSFTVGDGTAEVDMSVDVPVSNGGIAKIGTGTLRLTSANSYGSGTFVTAGTLLVNNTSGSGTGTGTVAVNGGRLGGTGAIAGAVTVSGGGTIAPGTASALGKLTLNSAPTFNGTNFMRVDRNGGSPLSDKLSLVSGTLTYGGTLVVSNSGAALVGGEVFTIFLAPSYAGGFTSFVLPQLFNGMNWYTGNLLVNGSIRVNRKPVPGFVSITNHAPNMMQIPVASLIANATDADGDPVTLASLNMTSTNGVALMTNSTSIMYSNYVSIPDRIDYTISDGHGGTATGSVLVAASPDGRFTTIPTGDSHSVTLHIAGRPGWPYNVERSTNLVTWLTVSTNSAPASGLFDFTDDFHDLSEPAASAFYRLRWLP